VSFIKDEKVKIKRFMSGIPSFYKEKIQFDEPKNLQVVVRKAKCLYEQNREKTNFQST